MSQKDEIGGLETRFNWFIAVVENNDDPDQQGRVKIRIFGKHHERIGRKFLPWARIIMPPTSPGFCGVGQSPTGLLRGCWVLGFFLDGKNEQDPVIIGGIQGKTPKELKAWYIDKVIPAGDGDFSSDPEWRFCDPWPKNKPQYPFEEKMGHHDSPEEALTIVPPNGELPYFQISFSYTKKQEHRKNNPNIETAFGDDWKLPDVKDYINPSYPKNHVTAFERPVTKKNPPDDVSFLKSNGKLDKSEEMPITRSPGETPPKRMHVREYDTTPGFERISEIHTSGTYYEVHPDGSRSIVVVGDGYEIISKDKNVKIKGNCNITIDGDARTLIKGNHYVHVKGNRTELIEGNLEQIVKGDVTEIYESNQTIDVTKKLTETIGEDVLETYKANHKYILEKDLTKTIKGDVKETTEGGLIEKVNKDVEETVLGGVTTKIRGKDGWNVNTWSDMNLLGGFYDKLINEKANAIVKSGASAILMSGGGGALGSVVDIISGGFAVHTLAGVLDMFGGRITLNGPGLAADTGPMRDRLDNVGGGKNGLTLADIIGPITPDINHPAYTPPVEMQSYGDLDLGIVSIAGVEFPTFADDALSLITDLAECCNNNTPPPPPVNLELGLIENFGIAAAVTDVRMTNKATKPWTDVACGFWPALSGNRITLYSKEARIYYEENAVPTGSSPFVTSGQTITLSQLPTTLVIKSCSDDGILFSDPVCRYYIENPFDTNAQEDISLSPSVSNIRWEQITILPDETAQEDISLSSSVSNIQWQQLTILDETAQEDISLSPSIAAIRWQDINIIDI